MSVSAPGEIPGRERGLNKDAQTAMVSDCIIGNPCYNPAQSQEANAASAEKAPDLRQSSAVR